MNKVKLPPLSPPELRVLDNALNNMLQIKPTTLHEKCIFACLAEFYQKVIGKRLFVQPITRLRLPPAQAAAYLYAYRHWLGGPEKTDPFSYTTLTKLAEEVHRQIL